jgi:predicted hydrocarbon binding protein
VVGPTASESLPLQYSNQVVRILLQALEEVLGQSGVNAVLNLAQLHHLVSHYPPHTAELTFSFAEVQAILRSLDEMYGPRAGRGLALRTGRACFKYGLREFGSKWKLTETGFRLLPLTQKVKSAAEACAVFYKAYIGRPVDLSDDDQRLVWRMAQCPECAGRQTTEPCCHLAVGLLQEAAYWASNGKYFEVEEVSCVAGGNPVCTLVLDKRPLD